MNETREDAAKRLRAEGLKFREIAEHIGCSTTEVTRLLYPEKAERMRQQSLESKRRRTGVCRMCGGVTKYAGHGNVIVSDLCASCAPDAHRLWDEGAIIAAMRRWSADHGGQPTARDWLLGGHDGYPSVEAVQRIFGSWNNGVSAAGFDPLPPGRRTPEGQERVRLAALKWTKEKITSLVRDEFSISGVAASVRIIPGPVVAAAIREFGSWPAACYHAGVKPRGHTYRDRACACGYGPTTAKGLGRHQRKCLR